jgi:hypothetical protein
MVLILINILLINIALLKDRSELLVLQGHTSNQSVTDENLMQKGWTKGNFIELNKVIKRDCKGGRDHT